MKGLTLFVAVSKAGEPCFTLEIAQVPFTLGASPRCDVVLDDPFVSRKHAVVTLTRGQLYFADTSSNGSFFRGQRIVNQLLSDGDTVEIPPFEVRFEYALEDDEDRHTSLRGLDELISPEIRERMKEPPRTPSSVAPPNRAAPPPEMPAKAHEHEAPPRPVASIPETAAPAEESTEPPDASEVPAGEEESPEVTLVPAGTHEPQPGDAAPPVEATPPNGGDSSDGKTAVVPPPPPVPPRRPPVSRGDRPPAPRTALDSKSPPADEEPPTIAFATASPQPEAGSDVESEQEGTVHMPVGHLVSLPPYSLEVVGGPPDQVGRTYPLPSREVTVGRGDQADFRLDCDNISRVHASLSPQGPGEWLLRDLASLNGTFVADERITQVALRLGGELRLANAITLRLVETRGEASGSSDPA